MDLLDLSFADHLDWIIRFTLDFPTTWIGNSDKQHYFFFQTRKENSGFYGIFQIFPETQPSYQATLTQRQREFILNSSTQAKLEEQQSVVQQCSLI